MSLSRLPQNSFRNILSVFFPIPACRWSLRILAYLHSNAERMVLLVREYTIEQ